jgi:hypothetical protein
MRDATKLTEKNGQELFQKMIADLHIPGLISNTTQLIASTSNHNQAKNYFLMKQ